MSGNGEQSHVDLFVILKGILSADISDYAQYPRHIVIVLTKNDRAIAVCVHGETERERERG